MNPREAHSIRCLLNGQALGADRLPTAGPFALIAARLDATAIEGRQDAWEAFLEGRADLGPIAEALGQADPLGPAPEAGADEAEDEDRPDAWGPIRLGYMPEAEPFPLDVLPSEARDLAEAASRAIGCPVDLMAVSMLVAASTAIGGSVNIEVKPGHHESASIFAALVAPPSVGKSPCCRYAMAPIKARQARHWSDFEREHEYWEQSAKDDRGPEPKPTRLYVTDVTTEALGSILSANPRGLAYLPDELLRFMGSLDQYRAGKGGDRQFYLSVWSGEDAGRDRVNLAARSGRVDRPFLALVGGIQPKKLPELADGLDDGFLCRFLLSYPEIGEIIEDDDEGVADEIAAAWARLLERLMDRPMPLIEGRHVPDVVRLTPAAQAAWKEWKRSHRREMGADDFRTEQFEGYWGKLKTYLCRLALVIHLMHLAADETTPLDGPLPPISRETIEAAGRVVAYHKCHFRRVFAQMGGRVLDGGEDVRIIIRWIMRGDGSTPGPRAAFAERDAYRGIAAFKGDHPSMGAALRWMTDHNLIRHERGPDVAKKGPGRKRSSRYEVNPALGDDDRCLRIARKPGSPTQGIEAGAGGAA